MAERVGRASTKFISGATFFLIVDVRDAVVRRINGAVGGMPGLIDAGARNRIFRRPGNGNCKNRYYCQITAHVFRSLIA
jgi:hypothetical protein